MGNFNGANIFDSFDPKEIKVKKLEIKEDTKAEDLRTFKPSENDGFDVSDISPIDPEDMFNWGEEKFNEVIEKNDVKKQAEKVSLNSEEIMSPEMIEISSVMYVQILESVWGGVCSWFSGVTGDYDFDKKMKERYEKITSMYFKAQNVSLTPTHFFILMTVFVLFGSGWKAYGDRKRRLTAENFKRKSNKINDQRKTGEQTTLFETESVLRERQYFAAEKDSETGEAYYTKNPLTGAYSKKSERELVPPELNDFLFSFKERNGNWPTKKQVDTFLKS